MVLQDFFMRNPRVALGFSGGVDSSYLLYEGMRCGADITAYYVKTAFQPAFELRDAQRLAGQLGARLCIVEADVLSNRTVTDNPEDRCYHCKQMIFGALRQRAEEDGYPVLADGSNASDQAADRPGMRALKELNVRSPLRECGLTKQRIRQLSREAGLFTWDKPAYACLATRIPGGRRITAELLHRVEGAEEALFGMGFSDFRVRVLGEAARLQLPCSQLETVLQRRAQVKAAIEPFFSQVLLDLEDRRGESV